MHACQEPSSFFLLENSVISAKRELLQDGPQELLQNSSDGMKIPPNKPYNHCLDKYSYFTFQVF